MLYVLSYSTDRDGDSKEFEETLMGQFPKLREGGGFDLLKSIGGNGKVLEIVKCPASGYSVNYLREQAIIRSGILYVRPLQKDLDENAVQVCVCLDLHLGMQGEGMLNRLKVV